MRIEVDVSIIIVNYNTAMLLKDCIESITDKTQNIKYEVIVIDNASTDNSSSLIKLHFPNIQFIESPTNLGFGKANNLGASYAKGKYLFLLNSDTLLINNAICILNNFMNKSENDTIGVCGANLFTNELMPNYSYSLHYPSLLNIFLYRSRLLKLLGKNEFFNNSSENKEVAIVIGADLFIRKELYVEMNGFDPAFFMYIEDGELCYRIKKAGYKLFSIPEAKIIHYQGKSSTTASKLIMETSSYIYYFRKHHSQFTVYLYKCIEVFFAITKIILFYFISETSKNKAYISLLKKLVK